MTCLSPIIDLCMHWKTDGRSFASHDYLGSSSVYFIFDGHQFIIYQHTFLFSTMTVRSCILELPEVSNGAPHGYPINSFYRKHSYFCDMIYFPHTLVWLYITKGTKQSDNNPDFGV
jgi:hypothetical protein